VAAGAEVLTLGTKAGVDLDVLHRSLVGSGGSCRFADLFADMIRRDLCASVPEIP
jgi:3-hydroxyisobutyrate dehydrogenase-like beta-hydroxyacid dehydrogenase